MRRTSLRRRRRCACGAIRAKDTPLPPEEPVGKNPATGAVIDYWLAAEPGAARSVSRSADGHAGAVVRRFVSGETPPVASGRALLRQTDGCGPAPDLPRCCWRAPVRLGPAHAASRVSRYDLSIAAVDGEDTPKLPGRACSFRPGRTRSRSRYRGATTSGRSSLRPTPALPSTRTGSRARCPSRARSSPRLERQSQKPRASCTEVRKQLDALSGAEASRPSRPSKPGSRRSKHETTQAPNLGADRPRSRGAQIDLEGSDRAPTEPAARGVSSSKRPGSTAR